MKITLETIASGLVPVGTLREFVRPYGDRDMIGLHDEEAYLAGEAMALLLAPMPNTPGAILHAALDECITMIPFQTVHGATLVSVSRTWAQSRMGNGQMRDYQCFTFAYDDGVRLTEWVDYGDHGATLVVDAEDRPAFYCVMTSDGYFDTSMAAEKAGVEFDIVDRLQDLEDHDLAKLVGQVDPRLLASLPRRENLPPARPEPEPKPLTLKQLYAAPPSPVGRARLGRR